MALKESKSTEHNQKIGELIWTQDFCRQKMQKTERFTPINLGLQHPEIWKVCARKRMFAMIVYGHENKMMRHSNWVIPFDQCTIVLG